MSTARGLKVIKNNVNKNTEYKSEFSVSYPNKTEPASLRKGPYDH